MIILNIAELSFVVKQKEIYRVTAFGRKSANLLHQYGKKISLAGTCCTCYDDLSVGNSSAVDVERRFHFSIAIVADMQIESRNIFCKGGASALREKIVFEVVVGEK